MYRPLAALGLAGMIVLACVSLTKADDCGEKQTYEQAQAEIFKESAQASIMRLQGAPRDAFLSHLYSIGIPPAPENDEVWVAKWNDRENSASVLVFNNGCRLGLINGFPFELLAPGLGVGA